MKEVFSRKAIIILISIFITIVYLSPSWASPQEELKKVEQCVSLLKKSIDKKPVPEMFNQGKDRANWLKCANDFKKIVKKYPKRIYAARALFDLGNLYNDLYHLFHKKEDLDNALKYYSDLLEKYPKSIYIPEAHYRKGEIYLIDLKDKERAIQEFEKAVKYAKTEFSKKARERLSEIETEKRKERTIIVKDLRHHSTKKYTRVVVDLDGPVKYEFHRIKEPDRLYFDLKNSRIGEELQKKVIPLDDGILKAVRIGQFSPDVVRVVLDLDSIESFEAFPMENPDRLVIDISGISKPEPPITKETPFYDIKRIVIDPGHGGHDPGAIGKNGLEEKEVVLDIAKKLKDLIRKEFDVDIILTRDSDVFIPLHERTAIANMKEADLFLSIHANASPKPGAKGIETYLLNYTTDEEANRVAARENAISLKRQKEIQRKFMTDLDKTLGDLERDKKRDESLRFAHMVQNSMIENLNPAYNITNLGVRQALFYVLVGAKMPSILVEISFISNRDEEKRLRDNSYRQRIAQGILDGIKNYLASRKIEIGMTNAGRTGVSPVLKD